MAINFQFNHDDIENLIQNVIGNYTISPNIATSYFEDDLYKRPEISFLKEYSEIVSQFMKDLGFFLGRTMHLIIGHKFIFLMQNLVIVFMIIGMLAHHSVGFILLNHREIHVFTF